MTTESIYSQLDAEEKQKKRLAREAKSYVFSGTIGIQGGRLIFCSCLLIPQVLDLLSIGKEFRKPFWRQVKRITEYIHEKRYILPPLVIGLDGEYEVDLVEQKLFLFPGSEVYLIDGSRRKEALIKALARNPELADDSIGVMFAFSGSLKAEKWNSTINSTQVRMK